MRYPINSIKSTIDLAFKMASSAKKNDVFFLEGEVGSGKSTFVKHFLRYFDLNYNGSPTFGLLNEYKVSNDLNIIHMDLYREDSKSILNEIMHHIDDSIFLIEWASNNKDVQIFFPDAKTLNFEFDLKYRICEIS